MTAIAPISRPALVVLAAGMGSRFGGDKQVAQVGPRGEAILEFTAFDARRAGFAEIILVVRPENRQVVAEMAGDRIARHLPVRYVYQDIAEPLPGFRSAPGRAKPWGTAHALACALRSLDRPCGVVNADDWYSPAGIDALAALLARQDADGVLVAYALGRTLSPHGPVNRAVCDCDAHGRLASIVETIGITMAADGGGNAPGPSGASCYLAAGTPVSLNLWGFQPRLYAAFIADVETFIRANAAATTGESQLPVVAMEGCARHGWVLRADLVGNADWTGLTYQADRPAVQERLARATREGAYPSPLWG